MAIKAADIVKKKKGKEEKKSSLIDWIGKRRGNIKVAKKGEKDGKDE